MNHLAIVRVLSMLGLVAVIPFAIGAVSGFVMNETTIGIICLVMGISVGGLGAVVLLLTDKPSRRTRPLDALAVAILFWLVGGLVFSAPFYGYPPTSSPLAALYESISSLSTTGHSLAAKIETPLPGTLLVWRSLLHLIGAIASISIAASVFAALNLGGPGIHRNRYFSDPESSFFDVIPKVIRVASVLVISGAVLLGGLLLAYGVAPRDALAGGVSAITTGMVDPRASQTALSGGVVHAILLWLGLVVGTFGFVLVETLQSRRIRSFATDPEVVVWFGALGLCVTIAVFAGLPVFESIGWATRSLATSGLALTDPIQYTRVPMVAVLLPALIGGAALSAAGGVKLARVAVLSKRVGMEFLQLGYRGSVQQFNFRGRKQSEKTLMGVWVYLVGYIVAVSIGILLFSVSGLPFDDAVRAGVGSLCNAGYVLTGMISDLPVAAQVFAILGMILGRLEVIALLPALNPGFWQR